MDVFPRLFAFGYILKEDDVTNYLNSIWGPPTEEQFEGDQPISAFNRISDWIFNLYYNPERQIPRLPIFNYYTDSNGQDIIFWPMGRYWGTNKETPIVEETAAAIANRDILTNLTDGAFSASNMQWGSVASNRLVIH
ncbi:hypothetical protein FA95DRAFT_1566878 [Auriscalpium vulgare]|uniref:Uncharacterized protein n=1 Tax=Auriscalpium vulgare TaxID=40419 RepID=A0ACB8R7I6_9AGAM|nr:hypothetical protein FA95DRAFT_1566878 [Auriscalpium vulgare]